MYSLVKGNILSKSFKYTFMFEYKCLIFTDTMPEPPKGSKNVVILLFIFSRLKYSNNQGSILYFEPTILITGIINCFG